MAISFSTRQAIGAATTLANILTGTPIAFIGAPAVMTLLMNGDIAGMTTTLNVFTGGNPALQPLPASAMNAASTVGNVKADEDLLLPDQPIPGQTALVQSVTNPGAASNFTARYLLR